MLISGRRFDVLKLPCSYLGYYSERISRFGGQSLSLGFHDNDNMSCLGRMNE